MGMNKDHHNNQNRYWYTSLVKVVTLQLNNVYSTYSTIKYHINKKYCYKLNLTTVKTSLSKDNPKYDNTSLNEHA